MMDVFNKLQSLKNNKLLIINSFFISLALNFSLSLVAFCPSMYSYLPIGCLNNPTLATTFAYCLCPFACHYVPMVTIETTNAPGATGHKLSW
jgi:hypothetical protein